MERKAGFRVLFIFGWARDTVRRKPKICVQTLYHNRQTEAEKVVRISYHLDLANKAHGINTP